MAPASSPLSQRALEKYPFVSRTLRNTKKYSETQRWMRTFLRRILPLYLAASPLSTSVSATMSGVFVSSRVLPTSASVNLSHHYERVVRTFFRAVAVAAILTCRTTLHLTPICVLETASFGAGWDWPVLPFLAASSNSAKEQPLRTTHPPTTRRSKHRQAYTIFDRNSSLNLFFFFSLPSHNNKKNKCVAVAFGKKL